MDTWSDPENGDRHDPPGHGQGGPPEQRYFGLTATQFNVVVLSIIGAVAAAVGLFFFGGAGAVGDFFRGGDDGSSSESVAAVKTVTPAATEAPPEATPSPAPAPTSGIDDSTDEGSGGSVGRVLNAFDPFSLMGALGSPGSLPDIDISGLGGAPAVPSDQADGSLKAVLLQEGDLPPGFLSFGEMSFSFPTEDGTAEMAANMFASGDLAGGDFGTMVMSMAMGGPDVTSDFGDFDDLETTQAELDEAAAYMEEFGITLTEMRLLDASGLGDAGMGMHMAMDFSGMLGTFGVPQDESVPGGVAWDMYVFARGERALMVMVMWPSDAVSGVDARALADIMDARAAAQ